ncbi:MAG: ribonuclease HII [Gemmatimonadota bacterium]
MDRTAPIDFEREAWDCGLRHVVGVDEVGCGPLAGPVVAGAVVLVPESDPIEGVCDSKLLSPKEREEAAAEIRRVVLAWALGAASTREIERLNIRGATALAMRRALARLAVRPDRLLVDGRPMPAVGDHTSIVGGDRKSASIACASILAKVVRDRLMCRLDPHYPEYGWASNKGYATGEHLAAIRRIGPSPHHRATWRPVAQLEMGLRVDVASNHPAAAAGRGAQ